MSIFFARVETGDQVIIKPVGKRAFLYFLALLLGGIVSIYTAHFLYAFLCLILTCLGTEVIYRIDKIPAWFPLRQDNRYGGVALGKYMEYSLKNRAVVLPKQTAYELDLSAKNVSRRVNLFIAALLLLLYLHFILKVL